MNTIPHPKMKQAINPGDSVTIIESGLLGRVTHRVNSAYRVVVQQGKVPNKVIYLDEDEIKLLNPQQLKMAQDPLIAAAKKAYRASDVYKIDKLLEEESRWKRKQTIARNKVEEVREKISKLAKELAQPKGGAK